jgi:hypothetical protein
VTKRKRKADKPGRDPVDVIYDFERLEAQAAEQRWSSLHREVCALLKSAKREGPGTPPKRRRDRDLDSTVMVFAQWRRMQLKAEGMSREEALHEAAQDAAARDLEASKQEKRKPLTAASIRDRLEHPGRYRMRTPSPIALLLGRFAHLGRDRRD